MKRYRFNILSGAVALVLSFISCSERETIIPEGSNIDSPTKFEIVQKDNGKWQMLKNGEPFVARGAAANRYYNKVREFGGNVFRTYSTDKSSTVNILKDAYRYGLYVNMGLSIGRERDGFDYNNDEKVQAQYDNIKALVEQYKNHPAIFCWSVGNEAESQYKNKKLWTAINDIAKMIHEVDPNHPVTTALAGANVDNVKSVKEMAPEIDIISVNSYYPSPSSITKNLAEAGWEKPWMITEYGQRGTWTLTGGTDPKKLSWGGLVEQTSSEKAAVYKDMIDNDIMPGEDNGCVGSFAFLWGYQTHGDVLTWYSLFDKKGYTTEVVDELVKFWTGEYPANRAPRIATRNDVKMNGKIADDEIIVTKGSDNTATVNAVSVTGNPLSYDWLIYMEGQAELDGSLPSGFKGLIEDNTLSSIKFKAPMGLGNYRLCVFVRDDAVKKVAVAVIPFSVQ